MRTLSVGSKIGDYTITDHLGAGGAGTVFAASNDSTGTSVALKVLRAGAELNEEIHSRFIREISIAQKLDDPNILKYYDCGVEDGVLYYAMEQVNWGSLDDVLKSRGCLTWQEACECGIQICRGLQHLHEAGIIHRDLKPANIFLSEDGQLKLGDFGLAHDRHAHDLSMDGTTVGTAKYLAPEQARGERNLDGRTDLYALGCNLFEYLTGLTPFESENPYQPASFFEMMRRHVEQPPERVRDRVPSCPDELSDLINRLLSKERDQRPVDAATTAAELQSILTEHAQPEDGDAQPIAEEARTEDADEPLTKRLRETATVKREANTGMLIGIAIALCVVVGLAILANGGS